MTDYSPAINPIHYKTKAGLEAIDVIEAFEFNYLIGTCFKYLARHGKKGDALEDLHKARWFLLREIERRESELKQVDK